MAAIRQYTIKGVQVFELTEGWLDDLAAAIEDAYEQENGPRFQWVDTKELFWTEDMDVFVGPVYMGRIIKSDGLTFFHARRR